ncbi:MAG TPA: hypothetical protein VGB50_02065 [Flavobacterium sp.]|jgi:hypothetical protein
MKTNNLLLGAAVLAVAFTSCKNEEEERAEKSVDRYVTYVDSIGNVADNDARTNWQAIDAEYSQRTADAEAAMANMKDKEKAEERLNASRAKYEEMKARYEAQMAADNQAAAASDPKSKLRSSLFGEGNMGADMNFDWVNKDNILRVYNDFYNNFDKNKDNYSREDFDEIKAMYEALDARKNTVEKEGLSGEDNRKIAELKVKFGPKFKWNRVGEKGQENERAKEEAK